MLSLCFDPGLLFTLELMDDGEGGIEYSVVCGDPGIGVKFRSPPLDGSPDWDFLITCLRIELLWAERFD